MDSAREAAAANELEIADGGLVENQAGEAVILCPAAFTKAVVGTVKAANTITTVSSATAQEIQAAMPTT